MLTETMNEKIDEKTSRTRRFSVAPTTATIAEESTSNPTISNLVVTNPVIAPETTVETLRLPFSELRQRRRSSVSILNTIDDIRHKLPIRDARQRNHLVGCSRPVHENDANDLHACFPKGRSLTAMVTTWNTAETKKLYELNYTPTARAAAKIREEMHEDLADILLPTCIDYVADLIIVNTQETAPVKESNDWEILLQEVIGPTHVLYHSAHHGSLSLCIFIRRDLIWFCSKPEHDVVRFRIIDPVRTKASLIVCFYLFGTSFMVINSHFQDGHSNEGRLNRSSNFSQTVSRCSIPKEYFKHRHLNVQTDSSIQEKVEALKSTDSAPPADSPAIRSDSNATKACDCVFWAGDFNFRVTMDRTEILDRIEHSKYSEIVERDEFHLLQEQTKEPFISFKEAKIDFAPTYKFDRRANSNSDVYIPNRVPAYTDRILYREKIGSSIECTKYESVTTVKHSDHKPVLAHFRIKLKPGSSGEHGYGRFNHEVYRQGCQLREKHHSYGVGLTQHSTTSAACSIL